MASRSIIWRSRRLRQIIDTVCETLTNHDIFVITESNNCFFHSITEFFFKEYLRFICIFATLVMDSGFKTLKLRAKERNNSQHCWPNNVGSCCVRWHKGKSLNGFTLLRNKSQQHATTCNRVCKRTQPTTCNIHQCCVRFDGASMKTALCPLHPCRSIWSQIFNAFTLVCF